MVVDVIISLAEPNAKQDFIDVIAVDEQPLVAARSVIFTQNLPVVVVVVSPCVIGVNKVFLFNPSA